MSDPTAPRRLRDASLGGMYLVVIAALIALSIAVYDHAFTSYTTVTLKADSVGNALQKGSDVKVRGVLVGSVSSIDTSGVHDGDSSTGTDTVIQLDLNPSEVADLPANVTAQLLPKTLFGERYVALILPSQASGRLHSGQTIYQDDTPGSVELQKVFSDLQPVLTAVQPEKLAATLGEISAALRGNGADIAATMKTVGGYLDQLAPNVPQLTADFAALATTADTYTTAAPDLIDALNSFSTTSQTIVAQKQDLTSLLAAVTAMSGTVQSFVSDSQDDIIGLSASAAPSLKIAAKYSSEFPCLLGAVTTFIPVANKAFGAGTSQPGPHVQLKVVPRVTPYTTADLPTFSASLPPQACPYTQPNALAQTAIGGSQNVAGAGATADGMPLDALGSANSPRENQLIAELVAPTVGMKPSQFPQWSSLLLGPALRGTEVSDK